ncbi:sporulation and spore germination protein [Actinomadura hallensis]|uniref:Sporulation and spore germination protein n=1 Tax=Actinomadura hallensis TaxID=337895 RepID=A0A543I9Z1_9ACTN|nr:LpqB family beta-propeller domain-containing protein [Actinomadura hallensis]TQM67393.1 sporulation and spore germination protein [Actinomadura hallensis]
MTRRITCLLVAAAFLLGGAGCATVPSGGQVVEGESAERAERVDDPYVRLIPVKPHPEWGPAQIVSGFLAASASFDDNHKVAKQYLSRDNSWNPGLRPSVTVLAGRIDDPQVIKSTDRSATVRVTGEEVGTISSDGQYTASPKELDATFQLAKTPQGVWRITSLPGGEKAGLLLTQDDVERAMRTVNLFFYAPDRHTLVPNGIFLPVVNRQTLPTQLVHALLTGPTSWLKGAVQTAFPEGTRLKRRVHVENEVATVDLTEEARAGNIERMSAQLSWTMRQLSEIKRWRLQIDGETVTPDGMDATQPVHAWEVNSPDGRTSHDETHQDAYVVGPSGFLGTLEDDRAQPVVTGAAGSLSRPAVAPDYQEFAGLSSNADQVLVAAPVNGTPTPRVMLNAQEDARFTAPSWSSDGTLWVVESKDDESWLWVRRRGEEPVRAAHWGLGGREVLEFRVARDGVRAAVIARVDGRPQVQIGRIAQAPDGSLDVGSFLPVSSELQDAVDLAWRDYNTLAVLGRAKRDSQTLPFLMPISGSAITSLGVGSLGEPQTIAAAPGAPVLIGTRSSGKDQVCRQRAPSNSYSPWICPTPAKDPSYPR